MVLIKWIAEEENKRNFLRMTFADALKRPGIPESEYCEPGNESKNLRDISM